MMKRFKVFLRLVEGGPTLLSFVTAPTAIAAIQAEMVVKQVRFAPYALAFESGKGGKGESATLTEYVYVPAHPARKAVR